MLRQIHVANFALIEKLDLEFGEGLNILTGETGAGKSIVVDALSLALGERASGDQVRAGADRAIVEAVFDLADAPTILRARLAELGLDDEGEDMLILARELAQNGKSQGRINGRLVPASSLRQISDGLIDIHGQHEHQTLLAPERHVDLLDAWLGKEAIALRDLVARRFAEVSQTRRQIEMLHAEARERARNLDLYRFQQEEIAQAKLKPGELEELAQERSRLANAEKLMAAAEDAYAALSEAALDGLNAAAAAVARAEALDEALKPISEQLTEALAYADEARRSLRGYREAVEFNPERLEQIGERMEQIHSLQRKYGETVEEILAYTDEITDRLSALENSEAREVELTQTLTVCQADLEAQAGALSELRQKAAARFSRAIMGELKDLGMADTRFEVSREPQPIAANGADRIEFLISPNPGEPMRPLARIASGGETSRIMLAMKSVLAQAAYVPTLIFDEIDIGVGGRTASVLAEKLSALSANAQILCITHLPQIASQPVSRHFQIEKLGQDGRTVVSVRPLTEEARIDEIARMLGGGSPTALQHAREMLGTK